MSSFNPNPQNGGNSINPDDLNYAEEWSYFKAQTNVDMNGFIITNTTFDLSDQNLEINNLQVDGTLSVSGDTTISGETTINSNLNVMGDMVVEPTNPADTGRVHILANGGNTFIEFGSNDTADSKCPLVFTSIDNGTEYMRIRPDTGGLGINMNPNIWAKLNVDGNVGVEAGNILYTNDIQARSGKIVSVAVNTPGNNEGVLLPGFNQAGLL